jgi:hypothetical protein
MLLRLPETDALTSWDAEIRGVCASVNSCVDRINSMHAMS